MYRTRIILDVLHEEPMPAGMELDTIVAEGTDGAYVLDVQEEKTEKLSDDAMEAALRKAGSTPDFFFPEGDELPEHRKIEGVSDEAIRWAEGEGML